MTGKDGPKLDLSLINFSCPSHSWRLAVFVGKIPKQPLCFECIVKRDGYEVDLGAYKKMVINTVVGKQTWLVSESLANAVISQLPSTIFYEGNTPPYAAFVINSLLKGNYSFQPATSTYFNIPSSDVVLKDGTAIARYFSLKNKELNLHSSDLVLGLVIDGLVDLALSLKRNKNVEQFEKNAEKLLSQKKDYLVGTHLTLADLIVWEAVKETGVTLKNLSKWFQSLDSRPEFQAAFKNLKKIHVEKEAPKVEAGGKQEKGGKSAPAKEAKPQQQQQQQKKEEKKPQEKPEVGKKPQEKSEAAPVESSLQVPNFVLYYIALGEKNKASPAPQAEKPSAPVATTTTTTKTPAPAAPVKEEAKKSDEDFDLFGEDDEHELEIIRKAKESEDKKKAEGKVRPVAKSIVVLDVSPESTETDLVKLEEEVRKIAMDGLEWKAAQLIPVAYGIKKLRISCHIVDDLVSVDIIQETIEDGLAEYVSSTTVQNFTKL